MTKILIVGIDSLIGRSLAQHLATRCSVSGLWLDHAESIKSCSGGPVNQQSLSKQTESADVVIFCGGASRSSWDNQFGTFSAEQKWLKPCIAAAGKADTQLVFISSDAVFSGPWVFHDDATPSLVKNTTSSKVAKTLVGFEAQVTAARSSLVVRTNVLGWKANTFLGERLDALLAGRRLILDATTFSTPIVDQHFAPLLEECLQRSVSGYIHIGGGERTSPFSFAVELISGMNKITSELTPNTISRSPSEQSLRCSRLRQELHQQTPILKVSIEAISDPALEIAHAVAA